MIGEVKSYGIYSGIPNNEIFDKKVKETIDLMILHNWKRVTIENGNKYIDVSFVDGNFHVDDVTNEIDF